MVDDENIQHIFEVDVPTLLDSLPEILTKEVNHDEEERGSDGVLTKMYQQNFWNYLILAEMVTKIVFKTLFPPQQEKCLPIFV